MLDQSRSVIIDELKKALDAQQKKIEAIRNPSQLPELDKAKEIAKNIENELSRQVVRRAIAQFNVSRVLRQTSRVIQLKETDKPYQTQKTILELRKEIKALMDNLHGDPKTRPNYPWDDEGEEDQKKDEEKKKDDKENKKSNK